MAVWLSMHASIAAHSFGARLLTRFVRLPLMSRTQLQGLTFTLKDFERKGVGNVLRVPFLRDRPQQAADADGAAALAAASVSTDLVDLGGGVGGSAPKLPSGGDVASRVAAMAAADAAKEGKEVSGAVGARGVDVSGGAKCEGLPEDMLPEDDEKPFAFSSTVNDDETMVGAEKLERHVELFRALQYKWQCYDSYVRVCMGLGVNQMLQVLNYYSVCHTLVENHSPTTGIALVAMFQCTTVALGAMEVAGLTKTEVLLVQIIGMVPCCLTAYGIARGTRNEKGVLDADESYWHSPLSFLFTAFWLELWLRISAPSADSSMLPRRFRQVLFLDVFGDAGKAQQEEDAEIMEVLDQGLVDDALGAGGGEDLKEAGHRISTDARQASSQILLAQSAIRRWRAAPDWTLSRSQHRELAALQAQLSNWGHSVESELRHESVVQWLSDGLSVVFEPELRRFSELSEDERQADPFVRCLVGPFDHDGVSCQYYYDVEGGRPIFEDGLAKHCPGAMVLSLQAVTTIIKDLDHDSRRLLEARIVFDLATEKSRRRQTSAKKAVVNLRPVRLAASAPMAVKAMTFVPNISSLFRDGGKLPSAMKEVDLSGDQQSGDRGASAADQSLGPANHSGSNSISSSTNAAAASGIASGSGVGMTDDVGLVTGTSAASCAIPANGGVFGASSMKKDLTLVAVAGQNARFFAPERLPWLIFKRMTRVMQVCWLWATLMATLREFEVYQHDFGIKLTEGSDPETSEQPRRLASEFARALQVERWSFEPVEMKWPLGTFFRPRGLFCLPASRGEHDGKIAVWSPFVVYAATTTRSTPLRLEERQRMNLPPSTVAMCDGRGGPLSSCLMATVNGAGSVLIWPAGQDRRGPNSTLLQWEGASSLRLLAGSTMLCTAAADIAGQGLPLLPPSDSGGGGDAAVNETAVWCLAMAAWDSNTSEVSLAMLPLPDGPSHPPAPRLTASPSRRLRLTRARKRSSVADFVVALHLEPLQGRLWLLLIGGDVEAWDLLASRSLGRSRPRWPQSLEKFGATALCEDSGGHGLFALGRSNSGDALLMRAQLPVAWRKSCGNTQ
eukprot:TRINITY_DN18811_c0_g1_i2.p1 TRINITY_DN18811_c0_g1~~TRINITY_DN18811_c0_g1_i2.p1  ORF type:complete len:1209 (-),score=217.62 TRINITY_DN18811_c0_g1_i2:89-3301(-)